MSLAAKRKVEKRRNLVFALFSGGYNRIQFGDAKKWNEMHGQVEKKLI